MPTNFNDLVGYDRVQNYPLWLKSVSIQNQPPLYLCCVPDAPTLKSRSSRPTPVLPDDQSQLCTTNARPIPDATTLTTLTIGPTPDLISTPSLKLHSHQTADQPPTNPDQFLWLGRVWSEKKLPALIVERIYPRSTPAISALYPWCIHAQIPLFPTYPRLPANQSPPFTTNPRPIPDATTLTTLNAGPTPDLISKSGLKWTKQANLIPTDTLMCVQYPKYAHDP